MSPRRIYRVAYLNEGLEKNDEDCQDDICRKSFSFQWLREEEAVVSLSCTTLKEQVSALITTIDAQDLLCNQLLYLP